jgi:hypothetical protein
MSRHTISILLTQKSSFRQSYVCRKSLSVTMSTSMAKRFKKGNERLIVPNFVVPAAGFLSAMSARLYDIGAPSDVASRQNITEDVVFQYQEDEEHDRSTICPTVDDSVGDSGVIELTKQCVWVLSFAATTLLLVMLFALACKLYSCLFMALTIQFMFSLFFQTFYDLHCIFSLQAKFCSLWLLFAYH